MREVEVSRFVRAHPAEVERALSPTQIVEYEGSFEVFDVDRDDDATVVEAGGRGLRMALRFEPREDGIYYEQEGKHGPFEEMWTRLQWTNEDEGTRVSARSGVSLRLPLSVVSDRIAVWKRRGEIRRALRRLADDIG